MTHRTSDSRALKPASSAVADAGRQSSTLFNPPKYERFIRRGIAGKYTFCTGKITIAAHGFICECFYSALKRKTVLTFWHADTLAASLPF